MPVPGDYVLLPQFTMAAPNDGILYAQIDVSVPLVSTNPYNVSGKKGKIGWKLTVLMDPPTTIIVPRHLVITSVDTELLAEELEFKPREYIGLFIVKGLVDKNDKTYINYGQIIDFTPATDTEPSGFLVTFRPTSDGLELMDQTFTEEGIAGREVTIQQFALGLGMGQTFKEPEETALRFADQLESFGRGSTLSSFLKTFKSVVIVEPTCIILDGRLEAKEIDTDRVLTGFVNLYGMIHAPSTVQSSTVVGRSLTQEFDAFNIDNHLEKENVEVKPTASGISFGSPEVAATPQNPARSILVSTPAKVAPMEARNSVRQMMRQTSTNIGQPAQVQFVSNPPAMVPAVTFDPSTFKQQHMASKLAYVPTEPQMHRHSVTFRSGVYGKSSTKMEHMGGIEVVFEVEVQYATTRDNAQIRTYCIMVGDGHKAPMQLWESCDSEAFNFEESYRDLKWSKLPEVDLKPVDDMDVFWRLYNQFQLAASRYYVDGYCRVLEHIKQNLIAGILQYGGKEQFESLSRNNRITFLQSAIKYMRAVVGKYMNELLLPVPQPTTPIMQWISGEGIMSSLYQGLVSSKWQAIQMRDIRMSAIDRQRGGVDRQRGGVVEEVIAVVPGINQSPNPLSKELKATIPKVDGINACLVSFTNRGCNNPKCTYKKRTPEMGQLHPGVQKWLKDVHGSYKK